MTTYSKITIAGSEIFPDQIQVSKKIGELNFSSTFSANINNWTGRHTGSYGIGDEVKIYCDLGSNPPTTQIFFGIVENIDLSGNEEEENMRLKGSDYSLKLLDRTVEPEVYANLPAGSIIEDIISKYTDDITTTNVQSGATISRVVFNHVPVFDAIKQLADISDFMFYVDNDKDLHFKEKSTTSSNITFGQDGNPILDANFGENRGDVFNDIWVYGDRYLDGYKETFAGSEATIGSIFTLAYKPQNTQVTVDSVVIQPGGIYGMSIDTGSEKYLVNYNDKEIIFTSGTVAGDNIPGAGSSVVIDYMRDLPIVKYGDNEGSIERYGRRTKVIQDTSIKDSTTAEVILLRELEEYSDPLKSGVLKVRNVSNITPGETCTVNIPFHKINYTTYDILEAKYNITNENLLNDNVLTVTVNKNILGVTDVLKDILLQQKKLQSQNIQSTDILTRYKISTGYFGMRSSGVEVYVRGIGSSFILGQPINGLLGSYATHTLGDWRGNFTLQWSGGYF